MNCKPGDMAEIIKVNTIIPEALGTVVTVLANGEMHPIHGWLWDVKPAWPVVTIHHTKLVRDDPSDAVALCPDAWLRPIRPPEVPQTITRVDEVTA